MTFLQPLILMALPLIGLPILIHFVNQYRYRTVHWAATMFLLQARRMATGMARLRYLLILLARMLVLAGLVFAVSRPMSAGWLGVTAGGTPDTTIIVLDRSASMEQQDPQTGRSKRGTALRKLSDLLQNTGSTSPVVLFGSGTSQPVPLESARDLVDLPETEPTSTTADLPALLQSVAEYITTNQTGRTDVWVCSDLRTLDWNPEGGRWEAIRAQLQNREGVRFYLLSYPETAPDNLAISVSSVHRRNTPDGAELVMDLKVTRTSESPDTIRVPVTLVINGARSTLDVEMTGSQLLKNGHVVPLDRTAEEGWGRLELPADSNPADNVFTFVYAEPAVQKTVVVSDDAESAEYFRLAAATSSRSSQASSAEVLTSAQAIAIPWNETALVIWQAPLPSGPVASQLVEFADSGRSILFFPPIAPDDNALFGARWTTWQQPPAEAPGTISRWRTDSDLLANTQTGAPLPVGRITARQFCPLESSDQPPEGAASDVAPEEPSVRLTTLARLDGGTALLTRAFTRQGAVWFCSTLPTAAHSNLITNGVVFYVMIQRALAQGAATLGAAQQLTCDGQSPATTGDWQPLDDLSQATLPSRRGLVPGVFQQGGTLLAVNRPLAEDAPETIDDVSLQTLFGELDYTRIDDTSGSASDLASEIWKLFLLLTIVALLAEALLCVPEHRERRAGAV